MVETIGYPEEDLETCLTCHGSGIVELCDACQEEMERTGEEWWA